MTSVRQETEVVKAAFQDRNVAVEGGNSFTFVTEGTESALEHARKAASGKDVSLAGGAKAGQEYLAANLVDEMEISLVPITSRRR